MKKFLKKLWDKVITSDVTPTLIGLLTIFGIVTWLVVALVFGVTTILNLLGVM